MRSIQAFKTEERAKIAAARYTIVATVGDQQSDLDGSFAECAFKVPNLFTSFPEEKLKDSVDGGFPPCRRPGLP
jgi:hypothetical protein